MEVTLSVAMSLDGYIDDASDKRLKLSSEEDWEDIMRLRAESDAVLVGAGTVRKDDPSLVLRDPELRRRRRVRGMPEDYAKVAVTSTGKLDPRCRFFTEGSGRRIVIAGRGADLGHIARTDGVELVVLDRIDAFAIRGVLSGMGFKTLMVEGGTQILTMFLEQDAAQWLRLAVAPFMVNDPQAPKFFNGSHFSYGPLSRMHLEKVERYGDMAVSWYRLGCRAFRGLQLAIEVSRESPPSDDCYRVGAVVLTRQGEFFTGYTHESGPRDHAEEAAIAKALDKGAELGGATICTSMEPCTHRASKPLSCTELIIQHGFAEVFAACREPDLFATCNSQELLTRAGVRSWYVPELAKEVMDINSHLLPACDY